MQNTLLKEKIEKNIELCSQLLARFVYEKNHILIQEHVSLKEKKDGTLELEFDKNLDDYSLAKAKKRMFEFNKLIKIYNQQKVNINNQIEEIEDGKELVSVKELIARLSENAFNDFFDSNNKNGAYKTLVNRKLLPENFNIVYTNEKNVAGKENVKKSVLGDYCLDILKKSGDSYLNSAMILQMNKNKAIEEYLRAKNTEYKNYQC